MPSCNCVEQARALRACWASCRDGSRVHTCFELWLSWHPGPVRCCLISFSVCLNSAIAGPFLSSVSASASKQGAFTCNEDVGCPQETKPVCGQDGEWYQNRCIAACSSIAVDDTSKACSGRWAQSPGLCQSRSVNTEESLNQVSEVGGRQQQQQQKQGQLDQHSQNTSGKQQQAGVRVLQMPVCCSYCSCFHNMSAVAKLCLPCNGGGLAW
jgi:hypothetical protein